MKSKKRLAIAAIVVLILAIAVVCIFAVRGDDEPVPETATSAPEAVTSAETAAAAQAEETSEAMAATFSPEDVGIVGGIEIDVLPDDETTREQTLDEQYSDFTDATISLPVVP